MNSKGYLRTPRCAIQFLNVSLVENVFDTREERSINPLGILKFCMI